jgi:hypothetical protein
MSIQSEASTLTPAQLEIVANAEIFDEAGKSLILGDLITDKRVVLVFIRHFCEYHQTGQRYGLTLRVSNV